MKIFQPRFTLFFFSTIAAFVILANSVSASEEVECEDCAACDKSEVANCAVTETWHFVKGEDRPVSKEVYYRCRQPYSNADFPIDVRYAGETETETYVDDDGDVIVYAARELPGDVTLEPPSPGGLEGNGADGGLFERSNFYSRYRSHEY
jgi:hypothetical protein